MAREMVQWEEEEEILGLLSLPRTCHGKIKQVEIEIQNYFTLLVEALKHVSPLLTCFDV